MLRQRDVALAERAAAAEQLAVTSAELRRYEERTLKAEEQNAGLLAERAALTTRASGAEDRHLSEVHARNAKADECTRLLEQCGAVQAEKRGKEELLLKLESQLVRTLTPASLTLITLYQPSP